MYWDGMLKMNTENLYNSSESWLSQIKINTIHMNEAQILPKWNYQITISPKI